MPLNRLRNNSIDEGKYKCFEGYNQIINDLSKNKRLLMNRRHPNKPSIAMLQKECTLGTPAGSKVSDYE